jgi:hypothetical protein
LIARTKSPNDTHRAACITSNYAKADFSAFRFLFIFTLLAAGGLVDKAYAQELTPRAYWPAPAGTNLLALGYQYSEGDIVTDPVLPITGVVSRVNTVQISYLNTFGLLGRTANVQLNLPFARGSSEGFIDSTFLSRSYSGTADARARLSVNLRGAPVMDAAGFQALREEPRTIVGASILVQMPTGSYEPDKLINPGTNRWAVKPAFGLIWPVRPTWLLEFEIGAWFFGDDDNSKHGKRRQNPILSGEFHLVKRVRPGFWVSLDFNYYTGGQIQINEALQKGGGRQQNSRIGGTLTFPFRNRNAIRLSYSTEIIARAGGDFNRFTLTYMYAWR